MSLLLGALSGLKYHEPMSECRGFEQSFEDVKKRAPLCLPRSQHAPNLHPVACRFPHSSGCPASDFLGYVAGAFCHAQRRTFEHEIFRVEGWV